MIGIIGAGNMGSAIALGIKGKKLLISDVDRKKLHILQKKDKSISVARDNIDLVRRTEVIIVAVKPQDIKKVLEEIKPHLKDKLIISIAAGVTTLFIEKTLARARVIRVMPNMPSIVGKGISALTRGRFAGSKDLKVARNIFLNLGEVLEVREALMDVVTAVSGSGPAYYFLFTYLLQKAGEANGLRRDLAARLARATFIGAAEVVKHSDLSMDDFIKKVASKGGTTEAALEIFSKKDLQGIIGKAVKAALNRSKNLTT